MIWNTTAIDDAGVISTPEPAAGPRHGGLSVLGHEHRELLNAVAAVQLNYGKPAEALALLQLCDFAWPSDPRTLRLMSVALLETGDALAADTAFAAYEEACRPARLSPIDILRKAAIQLGLGRPGDARATFAAYWGMMTTALRTGIAR